MVGACCISSIMGYVGRQHSPLASAALLYPGNRKGWLTAEKSIEGLGFHRHA